MVIKRNSVDLSKFNPKAQFPFEGTRTATLHKDGIQKLRENWIYRV